MILKGKGVTLYYLLDALHPPNTLHLIYDMHPFYSLNPLDDLHHLHSGSEN